MQTNHSHASTARPGGVRVVCAIAAAVGFDSASAAAPESIHHAVRAALENRAQFAPGELLVRYRPGAPVRPAPSSSVNGRAMAQEETLSKSAADGELVRMRLASDASSPAQLLADIAAVEQDPNVEYAEPNWRIHKLDGDEGKSRKPFPNDEFFLSGALWGVYGDRSVPANPFGTQVAEVWGSHERDEEKGVDCSDVYVGVIDYGVMNTHPDLAASTWRNPYDPVDGLDNDGNGFVDDRNGWDFYHGDPSTFDGVEDFHGTHVAGTIAATGNNRQGIAGICWRAKLISAKILGPDGGSIADAVKALDYLTDLRKRHGLRIVATNNSWGGGGYSQSLRDAIERSGKAGILFVAAAGNDGTDNAEFPLYPASYPSPNIISVAGIQPDGQMDPLSNFGATTVHLGAPGIGIVSTVPPEIGLSYLEDSGTSMAAPHVTGAAALYAHWYPKRGAAAIRSAILNGAMPTESLAGRTLTGGRLHIPRMLRR